jgi:hypothetical protein
MGRRSRARGKQDAGGAPSSDYADAEGNMLTLRGSFTLGARREYAETLAGSRGPAATTQEDAWQRGFELLFERLAVRWVISGVPVERQKELLARLRVATSSERAGVRDTLREHCAEWFPDVQAP